MTISGPPEGYWQQNSTQGTGIGVGNTLAPPPLQPQPQSLLSSNQYGLTNHEQLNTMSSDQYATTYPQMVNTQIGYQETQDMGFIPNQAGQAQVNPAGRYVFQADGSQLYVPFGYEQ
jgi:hypothetical protein